MPFRRIVCGWMVVALLAPALFFARPGAPAGGDCCTSMPCCATGGQCAMGSCDNPSPPSAAIPEKVPRLAAGCPGPTHATPTADRDPMVPAATSSSPAPWPRVTAIPHAAWPASARPDVPSEPPPRA